MFKLIDDLLLADEIAELRRIAGSANFIDGRSSNPHSPVKDNVHLHDQDAYMRSATIMMTALRRSEDLTNYAFPVRTAPPLLTRYSKQMKYGLHADAAFMQVGDIMLRPRPTLAFLRFHARGRTHRPRAVSFVEETCKSGVVGRTPSAVCRNRTPAGTRPANMAERSRETRSGNKPVRG